MYLYSRSSRQGNYIAQLFRTNAVMLSLKTRSAFPDPVYGMTEAPRSEVALMSANARLHIGDAQFVWNFQPRPDLRHQGPSVNKLIGASSDQILSCP